MREALERLVAKLDAVHADPAYQSVWTVHQLHCGAYTGPQYAEELAAARAALAAASTIGWQPIETAPRDGSRILAARFVGSTAHKPHVLIAVDRWRSRERGDAWDGLGKFNERFWPATHWMPLPAAPATERGGE